MKPRLKRAPEGVGQCDYEEGCDHVVRYRAGSHLTCACHIPIQQFYVPTRMLEEAIDYSALENQDFRVDGEGNISLEE